MVIALSIFQTSNLKSQNNRIRLMAIPVYAGIVAAYYASLSYEYASVERHTIGCQIHSNYSFIGMWERYRHSYNINLSYRYYFLREEKTKLFIILEPGYYELQNDRSCDSFWSNHYTVWNFSWGAF